MKTYPKKFWDQLHSSNGTTRAMARDWVLSYGNPAALRSGGLPRVDAAVLCRFRNSRTGEVLAEGTLRCRRGVDGAHVTTFFHSDGRVETL